MNLEQKKLKLALALEEEKNRLPKFNMFGGRNDVSGYDDAIKYLRTGKKPDNYEKNEILLFCVEDLETMFNDYEIE